MTAVTIFVLHPGAGLDFIAAVKKVNDALGKQADWPKTSGWLQLVNGGEGPTFVLLNSRKNWADFAPLPKTTADVLNEAYGKEVANYLDAAQKKADAGGRCMARCIRALHRRLYRHRMHGHCSMRSSR